jgi:hypothetical protein
LKKFNANCQNIFFFSLILFFSLSIISCKEEKTLDSVFNASHLHLANRSLIDISMEDIFNPPVATRVFSYPNLAAYEVWSHKNGKSIINEFILPNTVSIGDTIGVDFSIASLFAFSLTAKKLVFSEYMVDSLVNQLHREALKAGQSEKVWKKSCDYGQNVANDLFIWISKDNYAKVKADDQYTIRNTDSTWVLTPPNYEQALEPNWKKMRPIFIKKQNEFQPKPRPPFSIDKNSAFFKNALLVYNQAKINKKEETDIALHWDCNPNEFNDSGHNTHFEHKISPPGHWVSIAMMSCKKKNASFQESLKAYAAVTTAMFDGIIVCWNTKFSEELVRPVTYINKYIDKTWLPYIQTPPFPEYTSGHSTVSGCASTVLENMFPNTPFIDSTEVMFGLMPRKFESLKQAGLEASNSRFYGGIHYKFGVENGFENGQRIGEYVYKIFNN